MRSLRDNIFGWGRRSPLTPFQTPNSSGAMNRARLPTYCTLGDVCKLLPRAMAARPSLYPPRLW